MRPSRVLALAAASALAALVLLSPPRTRAQGDSPLPNVTWGLVDSISACPAGDSVVAGDPNHYHPSRLRITVRYTDANEEAKAGVPPESIWVTYTTTSGNLLVNDKDSNVYADDSTNGFGRTRITIPSFSGSGTLSVTLKVSGVSQGSKSTPVRTTDPDASGRDSLGSDQSTPGDVDWSGTITQPDINAAAAHVSHWRRNALHGTLLQRTSFDGVSSSRGDSRDFWSPSGRYISFSAHPTGPSGPCYIYIVASEPPDNTLRQVTFPSGGGGADDYDPSWSPLNHTLIYGRGDTTIFAHSLVGFGGDGSTYTIARHNDGDVLHPRGAILGTISPDGQWVVFCRRDIANGPIALYKIPISGDVAQLRKLTKPASGSDWYPQWSPDGAWIVFQRQLADAAIFGLYRVRADGDSTQIAESVYTASQGKPSAYDAVTPAYSPDGRVILAGIGPRVADSVFTYTLDPSLATIPAIPNYAEARFAARYVPDFPILGPLLSPDGTRVEIGANQVWAAKRNMRLPPRITSVKWLNIFPQQTTAIDDTTVVYEHTGLPFVYNAYQLSGTDAEGDTLWWVADVLGQGMSFDSTTRTLSFLAPSLGVFYYGRVRVSERSGGSDFLILKLRALDALGGLASSRAEDETALPASGPNPTREGYLFPARGFAGAVTVSVFDLSGRRVAILHSRAGTELTWDGRGPDGLVVPSGVYLYRMEAGRERSRGKIAVVR